MSSGCYRSVRRDAGRSVDAGRVDGLTQTCDRYLPSLDSRIRLDLLSYQRMARQSLECDGGF